jgi:hypothetical protein
MTIRWHRSAGGLDEKANTAPAVRNDLGAE